MRTPSDFCRTTVQQVKHNTGNLAQTCVRKKNIYIYITSSFIGYYLNVLKELV